MKFMKPNQIFSLLTILTNLTFTFGDNAIKSSEAQEIVSATILNIMIMFQDCMAQSMPNQQFLTDDLQSFINYPSKTTVGFAPKFTSNRRFFANMITTSAFKEMLSKDEEELRKDLIRKLKYCDEVTMDQNILKEFYEREVDQTKL